MNLQYIIKKDEANLTINQYLKSKLKISTRLLTKLIKLNSITLNNQNINTNNLLKNNDILNIDFSYQEDNSNIIPNDTNLDILYEDEWLIAINKPAGIAVHPSQTHYLDSLSNGLRYYFDKINLKKKIRPINRLDLNTSGIVLFAKCEYVHYILSLQMQSSTFKKIYLAIVEGSFKNKKGSVELPIARKPNSIIERCVSNSGQNSITDYLVLKTSPYMSLVECFLKTGRTHQIRVHMSAINHPLIGDTLYGRKSNLINRQALHCYKINFIHPITKQEIQLKSKLPNDFSEVLKKALNNKV